MLRAPVRMAGKLVDFNLAAKRVAVDSEDFGCAGLVAIRPLQRPANKFLFEFVDRFVQKYAALEQLAEQGLELVFHSHLLRTSA
jgi:hypothetical protein